MMQAADGAAATPADGRFSFQAALQTAGQELAGRAEMKQPAVPAASAASLADTGSGPGALVRADAVPTAAIEPSSLVTSPPVTVSSSSGASLSTAAVPVSMGPSAPDTVSSRVPSPVFVLHPVPGTSPAPPVATTAHQGSSETSVPELPVVSGPAQSNPSDGNCAPPETTACNPETIDTQESSAADSPGEDAGKVSTPLAPATKTKDSRHSHGVNPAVPAATLVAVDVSTGTNVQIPGTFPMPQTVRVIVVPAEGGDDSITTGASGIGIVLRKQAGPQTKEESAPASLRAIDGAQDVTPDAQLPDAQVEDAAAVGGVKRDKASARDGDLAVAPLSPATDVGQGTMAVQPQREHMPEQGATFRSSFLDESSRSGGDFGAKAQDAITLAEEPRTTPETQGSVKHLEISLNDARLGEISVRAEMKDGMLHASVLGRHADSVLTASALHQYLDQNQVEVHRVRVETASGGGVQKFVSTSSFRSESATGGDEQRGRRNQQDQGHPTEAANVARSGSGERNEWSRRPVLSEGALPQAQYGDGRSLSIHI